MNHKKNQPPNVHGRHHIFGQKRNKLLETLIKAMRIYSQDKAMELCHSNSERQKTKNDRMNRTTKKIEKIRTLGVKENYKYLGILEDERKKLRWIPLENEKITRNHSHTHKTEYMCYNQKGDISTLEGTPLKLVDKFTYLGSSVESTEKDIETRLTKAWTAINRLSTIWKSDLTDKMKRSFFQAAVTSILLYGCTTWTLTKRLEKKLDGNYTRMLRAILNKSWQQHPTRHQLYGHLPPITKSIQVRRTRHAGHCWRSRDELIRDVLLWIPTHGRAKAGRPARTYIQQLCEDTGCCPEDLPRAMNDREEWRERVRDIRAASTRWWWWWLFIKEISSRW